MLLGVADHVGNAGQVHFLTVGVGGGHPRRTAGGGLLRHLAVPLALVPFPVLYLLLLALHPEILRRETRRRPRHLLLFMERL
jgi:hypothetical protein